MISSNYIFEQEKNLRELFRQSPLPLPYGHRNSINDLDLEKMVIRYILTGYLLSNIDLFRSDFNVFSLASVNCWSNFTLSSSNKANLFWASKNSERIDEFRVQDYRSLNNYRQKQEAGMVTYTLIYLYEAAETGNHKVP